VQQTRRRGREVESIEQQIKIGNQSSAQEHRHSKQETIKLEPGQRPSGQTQRLWQDGKRPARQVTQHTAQSTLVVLVSETITQGLDDIKNSITVAGSIFDEQTNKLA